MTDVPFPPAVSLAPTLGSSLVDNGLWPRLLFAVPGADLLDLSDGRNFLLQKGLAGLGPSGIIKSLVEEVPLYDRSTYISSYLGPRLVTVPIRIIGDGLDLLFSARRAIWRHVNPKPGLGLLIVQPGQNQPIYRTRAVLDQVSQDGFEPPVVSPVTLVFKCPDPGWAIYQPVVVTPVGGGVGFPLVFPLVFSPGLEAVAVVNHGELDSYPRITFAGPCTGPTMVNQTTGLATEFPSLAIGAGSQLVVDMDARTALLDGVSVMAQRTARSVAWPLLGQGQTNTVSFGVRSGNPAVTIQYDERYLGI